MIRNDDKYSVFWIICLNSANFDQIKVQRRIFSGSFIEIRYTVVEVTLNQRNLIWADMFETKSNLVSNSKPAKPDLGRHVWNKKEAKKKKQNTRLLQIWTAALFIEQHGSVKLPRINLCGECRERKDTGACWWKVWVNEESSYREVRDYSYNKCIREIRGNSTLVLSIGSVRVIGL